jgi:hypothetical protein
MTVSKAQICNLALAHINQTQTTISNLDTDTGTTASQCRIHYDVCRRFVLADFNWTFAKKRVALADIGSPPPEWEYRYDYPSDCLAFIEIQRLTRTDLAIEFAVEAEADGSGLSILTDTNDATGVYVFDVENTSLFSPGFVSALSWYLASELAPSLSGDTDLQEAALMVYRSKMMSAQAVDSRQGGRVFELDAPWERGRE